MMGDPLSDDEDDKPKRKLGGPRTLAEANSMLKKGEKNLTDDDLFGYAGHLATDEVLKQGHNVGHKPKGMPSGAMKKMGYRKLPGTAANQIGVARGEAPTNLPPPKAERDRMAQAEKEFAALMKRQKMVKPKPMDVRIVANVSGRKKSK